MFGGQLLPVYDILGVAIMLGRSLPLRWDGGNFRFYPNRKPGMQILQSFIFPGLHRVTLVVLFYQVLRVTRNSESSTLNLFNWMALIMWTVYFSYLNFFLTRCDDMATLVNGILQFSQSTTLYWRDKDRRFTENINILCTLFAPFLLLFMAIGYVFGLHWFNPCKPTLVGYWLLCSLESWYGYLVTAVVLVFNFWIWLTMLLGGAACTICVHMLCPVAIRDCIYSFWKLEKDPGTVSFWKRCETYCQIQVVGAIHTDIQAGTLMTILILTITGVLPLSFVYTAQIRWTFDNIAKIISGAYLFTVCLIAIVFVIGGHAGVWSDSKEMFKNLDRLNFTRYASLSGYERKLQQTFWKSCRNLVKVKFGVNNYVEDITPLNCLNCSAALVVQLFLLDG